MVSTKQLEDGNIAGLILKFSGPAVVGMVVMAIYNVVDRIFIGQGVGPLGLAGITVGFPMMLLIMAVTMMVGIGASALVSIRLGEKNQPEAEKIMGNGVTLLVGLALILTVFALIFLTPLLRLFGASPNVMPYAAGYMRIILIGTVFQVFSFGANNFIRAEGNPKTAMLTMLIGAILNTILDPIFIFIFGMGVAGAALATIISQAVSAIWVLYYFLNGKSLLKFRLPNFKPQRDVVANIIAVGTPSFVKQLATSLIVIILNNSLLHYGGDIAISAMGVIHSVLTMMMMPIFGISQGAQPIIGYNYGAKKYNRVKQALYYSVFIATAVVALGYIAVIFFPEPFIRLFSSDPELIAIGMQGMRTALALLPILGFQIIAANYFQAVGKPKQAIFLNLARQVLLLIPALLILPRYFGLLGVWLAIPVADFGATVLTGIWLAMEVRYLDSKEIEYTLELEPQYES
ncbi:MAG: MATE family efflux transporter [Clostridiales bacterium]|jgi:putative MATE family efflux protein|nr:MATE family efflux transporter [Clostridiales bacterium]